MEGVKPEYKYIYVDITITLILIQMNVIFAYYNLILDKQLNSIFLLEPLISFIGIFESTCQN